MACQEKPIRLDYQTVGQYEVTQTRRVFATVIDLLFVLVLLIPQWYLMFGYIMADDNAPDWFFWLHLAAFAIVFGPELWFGRTPGKAILRQRIVTEDGASPHHFQLMVRWLIKYAYIGPLIAAFFIKNEFAVLCIVAFSLIWPLLLITGVLSRGHRPIHDRRAQTSVEMRRE